MPIDRFEPNSLTPEQQSVDAIKKSLNKEFSENLSGYEKDMERVERLRSAFDQVDHAFSAERITCPKDAHEMPFSILDGIVKGKPFEEQCTIISYFLANKIALTEPLTEERFQSFNESKERTEMVKAVKTYFEEQSVEDPNWEEEWNKFVSETQAYWEQRAAEAYAALQATGESIKENAEQLVENTEQLVVDVNKTAVEVWDNTVELSQEAAELIVDGAAATCYVTQMAAVGGVRFAENCADYVDSAILVAQGNEEAAVEVVRNNVTDELIERIDEFYDPNETLRGIGHAAVNFGETATGIGVGIAAFAGAAGTASGIAAFLSVGGTSLLALNAGGNVLHEAYNVTGKVGVRELTGATASAVATVAAVAVSRELFRELPKYVSPAVKTLIENLSLEYKVGERINGVLCSAAIAAGSTTMFRTADVVSDITNVALGTKTDFDIVQEARETLISVAGAAVFAGVGYDVFRNAKIFWLENIKGESYIPDYFDQVFLSQFNTKIGIKISPTWTGDQVNQATDKVGSLQEAASNGELVKTKVVRSGSATATYESEYGPGSVPKGYDVDHNIELQLGGADNISNMKPIDSSVNRSFGSQIMNQIADLPYGTPITEVFIV